MVSLCKSPLGLCDRSSQNITSSLHLLGRTGFLTHRSKSSRVSVAEEPTFRCEDCDELFQSKLDLRRHKKYACSAVGSLYDSLSEDIKQEGLGDGQVYECKDCERMFPNKYRYRETPDPPRPACSARSWLVLGDVGPGWELGRLRGLTCGDCPQGSGVLFGFLQCHELWGSVLFHFGFADCDAFRYPQIIGNIKFKWLFSELPVASSGL